MSSEVTVVVVTWQARELLAECLDSLAAQDIPHDVLVVDNASNDGTVDLLESRFPHVRLLRLEHNTGFAGGVCAALDRVNTPFVALLNNDATADPSWLRASLRHLRAHPEVAAVSARMLLADRPGIINNAGIVLLDNDYGADRGLGDIDDARYRVPARVFGASGGACVLRTLAVKAVGGVDPSWFLYYEDTDLSWRLRLAGWDIHYCPDAVVWHRHAASSDSTSASFAFYNERNRLLTLLRNAPASSSSRAAAAFVATTVSLAVKRIAGIAVPDHPTADPMLRARALLSAVRLSPRALARRSPATSARRRRVSAEWRGAPARPLGGSGSGVE